MKFKVGLSVGYENLLPNSNAIEYLMKYMLFTCLEREWGMPRGQYRTAPISAAREWENPYSASGDVFSFVSLSEEDRGVVTAPFSLLCYQYKMGVSNLITLSALLTGADINEGG